MTINYLIFVLIYFPLISGTFDLFITKNFRAVKIGGTGSFYISLSGIGRKIDENFKEIKKKLFYQEKPKNCLKNHIVLETLNKIIEGRKHLEVKASEPRNDK